MNVKQLIAKLQKEDPKRLVVCSTDAEGNSHSPLYSLWTGAYKDGEVGLEKLTPELELDGYTEEDVVRGKPCLILNPE